MLLGVGVAIGCSVRAMIRNARATASSGSNTSDSGKRSAMSVGKNQNCRVFGRTANTDNQAEIASNSIFSHARCGPYAVAASGTSEASDPPVRRGPWGARDRRLMFE